MANKSFFNGTDAELFTGGQNFAIKIAKNPQQYGLTGDQVTTFTSASNSYGTAYQAAIDPETRTKGKIAAKNAAKKSLKVVASDLAKVIDGTPTVTDQMKIDLGLAVRRHPTPHPAPTVRPTVGVASVVARTVTVNIYDAESRTKRGKPEHAVSAFVYTFVGATYPTDPTLWQFNGPATKSTYEITFPDTVANGAQVWVCAAWVNRRGETGPVSVPVTTFVQGGLSMAA